MVLACVCLASSLATYGLSRYEYVLLHREPKVDANVYMVSETIGGRSERLVGNLVTDIGDNYVRDILGFNNVTGHNATIYIALGNTTGPLAADTQLDEEIPINDQYSRGTGTAVPWMNGTNYAFNVTLSFTMANVTNTVNATSLHWSPTINSADNMFAEAYLGGSNTFNPPVDNCTITWVITFAR